MKNLPVGQQDFENLQQDNCVYVDKTMFIHRMLTTGARSYFLSRPRRFGKSLLLSTIKAVFEGKKELFKGLFIEDKIDWESYPVIMLDMTKDAASAETLKRGLANLLRTISAFHQLDIEYDEASPATMLEQTIACFA